MLTNYLENKLIDHLFRGTAYTAPTGLYFGLFTAAPGEAGGGTEVTGGAYARVNLAPSAANWRDTAGGNAATSSGTTGTTSNAAVVTFPQATASWGTVTHWGIFDAATAGNLLFYGALTTPRTPGTGTDPFSYPVDAVSLQLDT
jgi:hypothetical protein